MPAPDPKDPENLAADGDKIPAPLGPAMPPIFDDEEDGA